MDHSFNIDNDIKKASTMSSRIYYDKNIYENLKERIFENSWQFVTDVDKVRVPGQAFPHILLEGYLDEPLLFIRDFEDNIQCMSNVCTHRGFLLVKDPGNMRQLRCRYHGRKFDLKGCFMSMPEFEETKNFPTDKDNLPNIDYGKWGNLIFTSLNPMINFEEFIKPMKERLYFLPLEEFRIDVSRSKDYLVKANWALYVENYLEGFHIPYVHPSLNEVLNYGDYISEIYDYSNLQLGIAEGAEEIFDLPEDHPDYGKKIAAYYYWVFPNQMFNFYPWGLSINIVNPLDPMRTKVKFLTYVWKPELLDKGAGAGLDRVEREDEDVVELVQKGVKSKYYTQGRFSPTREEGVHHFHSLLSKFINKED